MNMNSEHGEIEDFRNPAYNRNGDIQGLHDEEDLQTKGKKCSVLMRVWRLNLDCNLIELLPI